MNWLLNFFYNSVYIIGRLGYIGRCGSYEIYQRRTNSIIYCSWCGNDLYLEMYLIDIAQD